MKWNELVPIRTAEDDSITIVPTRIPHSHVPSRSISVETIEPLDSSAVVPTIHALPVWACAGCVHAIACAGESEPFYTPLRSQCKCMRPCRGDQTVSAETILRRLLRERPSDANWTRFEERTETMLEQTLSAQKSNTDSSSVRRPEGLIHLPSRCPFTTWLILTVGEAIAQTTNRPMILSWMRFLKLGFSIESRDLAPSN
jgi:hypothetical protein